MSGPSSWAVFETAIGACAIVWGEAGLSGVLLPERDREALETRVRQRHPEATDNLPPQPIRRIIKGIRELLAGEIVTFADVELDLAGTPEFNLGVYAAARRLRPGETRTYGEIARELGDVSLSRAVGRALGQNPWPIVVPCHRVLAASGRTGGFSAPGGVNTKLRILSIEARHAPTSGLFADLPLAARPRP